MMSVYSESLEEKPSDAMVDLNLTANERSNAIHTHLDTFHLSYFFNLTVQYKCHSCFMKREKTDINHI